MSRSELKRLSILLLLSVVIAGAQSALYVVRFINCTTYDRPAAFLGRMPSVEKCPAYADMGALTFPVAAIARLTDMEGIAALLAIAFWASVFFVSSYIFRKMRNKEGASIF